MQPIAVKPYTVIVDIDGCIFKHRQQGASVQWGTCSELLPGVIEQFDLWEKECACIVLITARKESCRALLEERLLRNGLYWDKLIMGVTSGPRYLINDSKGQGRSAFAYTMNRNGDLRNAWNRVSSGQCHEDAK